MVRRLTQIHVGFLEFLSQFYEKEAFFMDQERASMLPMIAAGESVVTGGGEVNGQLTGLPDSGWNGPGLCTWPSRRAMCSVLKEPQSIQGLNE